jgi:hypothetical protein
VVTTVISTGVALARAGIDEMTTVVAVTVKHPGAAAAGHGNRVTGVPACCSAEVPISTAVGLARLDPLRATVPPPAIGPTAGVAVSPVGAVARVPAVVTVSVPGLASAEDAVDGDPLWIVEAATLAAVTIATTVSTVGALPWLNDVPLVVHVMVRPTTGWQTQPVPKAPTGTTPVGTVWVTDIAAPTLGPASTLAATL